VERFKLFRSPEGEEITVRENLFVAKQMPSRILRELTGEEMEAYLHTTINSLTRRKPMAIWTRQVPLGGEPRDVVEIVKAYGKWLEDSMIPKLFINAEPGSILTGRQRDYCMGWPNQETVTVEGLHFIQKDAPEEIGEAIGVFLDSL
jgi:haloalkane dehalogenase